MNERAKIFLMGLAVGVAVTTVLSGGVSIPAVGSFDGLFSWLEQYGPPGMAGAFRGVAIGMAWAVFGVGVWIAFSLLGRAVSHVEREFDDRPGNQR